MVKFALSVFMLVGLCVGPARAHAQNHDEVAKREYELGFKDFEQRRYRQALDHYQRSYDELARPRTTYNMALCQEALGNIADAIALYQKFLNEGESRDAEFFEPAREKMRLLHAQIGGTIRIRSEPSGAGVSVDGQLRGHTPLRLDLLAGEHLVSVGRKGTRSSERKVDVRIGDNRVEEFPLDLVGHVEIRVQPGDALIRRRDVDDVASGLYEADLSPGVYEFELSLLGYETRSLRLKVKEGDNLNQTVRLRGHSSTGALQVRSDEVGATVSVDGLIVGSTQVRNGQGAQLERRLSAGNHVIMVDGADGATWSDRVHVSPGETISLDLAFHGKPTARSYARWGLTGLGVAALASGLTYGVLALSDVRESSQSSHDRGFDRANTSDLLIGIGALSLGGAYLLREEGVWAKVERTHEEASVANQP